MLHSRYLTSRGKQNVKQNRLIAKMFSSRHDHHSVVPRIIAKLALNVYIFRHLRFIF